MASRKNPVQPSKPVECDHECPTIWNNGRTFCSCCGADV